jgi:hypothetical protein
MSLIHGHSHNFGPTLRRQIRTGNYRVKPVHQNYESGGQEFESLRARQFFAEVETRLTRFEAVVA